MATAASGPCAGGSPRDILWRILAMTSIVPKSSFTSCCWPWSL
uniref:NDC1 transmembrane nucleoporin n=1 Tax=Mus musculus TaxID=10090 RepID=J3QMD9_MOUSE